MSIESRLLTALVAVLESAANGTELDGVTITTTHDIERLTPPFIVLHAESGREEPINSGNMHLDMTVELHWPADPKTDENVAAFQDRLGLVQSVFLSPSLASTVNTAALDIHVFGVHSRSSFSRAPDDRAFVGGVSFTAYVAPSTLA